jgi:hypothetical protein
VDAVLFAEASHRPSSKSTGSDRPGDAWQPDDILNFTY